MTTPPPLPPPRPQNTPGTFSEQLPRAKPSRSINTTVAVVIAVVLAFMSILSVCVAVAVPTFLGARERAQERALETQGQAPGQEQQPAQDPADSSATTIRPIAVTPLRISPDGYVDPLDLTVGQCYWTATLAGLSGVELTDCSEPHSSQVVARITYDGPANPTESQIHAYSERTCDVAISNFVNTYPPFDLFIEWWYPSPEIEPGDVIVCSAGVDPGFELTQSLAD